MRSIPSVLTLLLFLHAAPAYSENHYARISGGPGGEVTYSKDWTKEESALASVQALKFREATAPETPSQRWLDNLGVKQTVFVYNDRASAERIGKPLLAKTPPRIAFVVGGKEYTYDPATQKVREKKSTSSAHESTLFIGFSKNHEPKIQDPHMIQQGLAAIAERINSEKAQASEKLLEEALRLKEHARRARLQQEQLQEQQSVQSMEPGASNVSPSSPARSDEGAMKVLSDGAAAASYPL